MSRRTIVFRPLRTTIIGKIRNELLVPLNILMARGFRRRFSNCCRKVKRAIPSHYGSLYGSGDGYDYDGNDVIDTIIPFEDAAHALRQELGDHVDVRATLNPVTNVLTYNMNSDPSYGHQPTVEYSIMFLGEVIQSGILNLEKCGPDGSVSMIQYKTVPPLFNATASYQFILVYPDYSVTQTMLFENGLHNPQLLVYPHGGVESLRELRPRTGPYELWIAEEFSSEAYPSFELIPGIKLHVLLDNFFTDRDVLFKIVIPPGAELPPDPTWSVVLFDIQGGGHSSATQIPILTDGSNAAPSMFPFSHGIQMPGGVVIARFAIQLIANSSTNPTHALTVYFNRTADNPSLVTYDPLTMNEIPL